MSNAFCNTYQPKNSEENKEVLDRLKEEYNLAFSNKWNSYENCVRGNLSITVSRGGLRGLNMELKLYYNDTEPPNCSSYDELVAPLERERTKIFREIL